MKHSPYHDGYCWVVVLPSGKEVGHPLIEKAQLLATRLAKEEVTYLVPRAVPREKEWRTIF